MSPANPINPGQPVRVPFVYEDEGRGAGLAPRLPDPSNAFSDIAAKVPFQNVESAKIAMPRAMCQLSAGLRDSLPGLLAESPDPDFALTLFDRLVTESPDTVQLLNQHNSLAHYAIVIFGHSRFLAETLIQNPEILQSFIRERNLDVSFSREDFQENLSRFRSGSLESDISLLLAHFKRREYVRIMLRDVLKIAPLSETTAEISNLADVLISEALRDAGHTLGLRYGIAQNLDAEGRRSKPCFSVLSLGKLGGNELNYSSDVDLMYLFSDVSEPPGAKLTNREYFIYLAQAVTGILSRVTREGPVFRIDLRLRPQGNEGELAISLENALRYYEETAEDWERQALIKIRHSAGDLLLAREFMRRVQPQVYEQRSYGAPVTQLADASDQSRSLRSDIPDSCSGFRDNEQPKEPEVSNGPAERLNFAAIKTALVARERMAKRRRLKLAPAENILNVKLDHGGIRDIEFLVQCLQRVYGGAEPWLRSGGTLFSLQKLHDKGYISGKEFHKLTGAYELLRHVEHRLQLRYGQQIHQLPIDGDELKKLQRAMEGYDPEDYQINDLVSTVRRRMAGVAEIYQRIIYQQQNRNYADSADVEFKLNSLPEVASDDLSNQQILRRLAKDMPELHQLAGSRSLSLPVRKNLFRFLSSAFTSSGRYAEIVRNSEAMDCALKLFDASEYLTDILIRYPEEIATLMDIREPIPLSSGYLFAGPLGQGRATADPVFEYVAKSNNSYAEKLSLLRKHFRHRVLAAGARDITSLCGVYESMDSTTAAAEDAIAAAFVIAGNPDGLAVLAVGRLGSRELDVFSDADLLFVGEREKDRQRLTKSAEQIIQALSVYTRDGMVFPVDTRLRPRGSAGELLITPGQLAGYFEHEAQPWEALMYTKLRFVAGSRELGDRVISLTEKLFRRFAADSTFKPAVCEMRAKLALVREKNFKTSLGGTYDIDFLTGVQLIEHGVVSKQGSLRDRLWKCAAAGLLENSDAAQLDHAAELLRTVEHIARLSAGKPQKWLPATEHAREVTEKLTGQILRREFSGGLEAELLNAFAAVRSVYERVINDARCG